MIGEKGFTEIEVIASTNKEGKTTPHRIRLTSEEGEYLVVPIISILYSEEVKRENLIKYRIRCVVWEKERYYDLYFNKVNMKWFLKV